jgi:hypothetical protein
MVHCRHLQTSHVAANQGHTILSRVELVASVACAQICQRGTQGLALPCSALLFPLKVLNIDAKVSIFNKANAVVYIEYGIR